MGRQSIRSVAILGGGPAGATLATYLAQAGVHVVVFTAGKRPPIIVGESLVPAIVPFLRRLGVEEEVASFAVWKGGATFVFDEDNRLSLRFSEVRGATTTYAYNVPRDRFDATLLDAARRAGAHVVDAMGRVERVGESDRIRLTDESLAAAGDLLREPPDLIVDAGGRSRRVARLFDLPTIEGQRRDTALHAHLGGVEVEIKGNVHTDRLSHGWCWRIPLPDRVSLGFVMDGPTLRKYGDSAEEQYDTCLRHDPVLKRWAAGAERLTPVVKYTNYQLRATRGVGENWALVGDAYGFIDPVFSSGLLVAFEAASDLAQAILRGTPRAFDYYQRRTTHSFEVWQRVIELYYSGRLFTLFRVGEYVSGTPVGRMLDFHFRKHMPRIFTGEAVHSRYSLFLISFMAQYGLAGNDPDQLRIN